MKNVLNLFLMKYHFNNLFKLFKFLVLIQLKIFIKKPKKNYNFLFTIDK